MVEEPSHVNQLSVIHVCKIGLRPATIERHSFLHTPILFCFHVCSTDLTGFGDINISAILNSFQMGYDKRVRPNYGGRTFFLHFFPFNNISKQIFFTFNFRYWYGCSVYVYSAGRVR
jgi:hypothetical protein